MNNQQAQFEAIERYLANELTPAERASFESQMDGSPELTEEVELHRVTNQIIVDYGMIQMRRDLGKWHKDNDSGSGFSTTIATIGIVGALIIGLLTLYNLAEETSPDQSTQIKSNSKKATPHVIPEIKNQPREAADNGSRIEKIMDKPESLESKTSMPEEPSATQKILRKNPSLGTPITSPPDVKVESIEVSPCVELLPDSFIEFNGSCQGERTGSIMFSNQEVNGRVVKMYSIDSGASFSSSRSFLYLENGVYHPMAVTGDGCVFGYPTPILLSASGSCNESESVVIDITLNQYWEPNLIEPATLQIRNQSGRVVFRADLTSQLRWYGVDSAGELLPMGAYTYIIDTSDGRTETGEITLIR